jgi:hypothetical protein
MKSSFIYPVAAHGPCHMTLWQPQAQHSTFNVQRVVVMLFVCITDVIQTNKYRDSAATTRTDALNFHRPATREDGVEGGRRRGWMVTSEAWMGLEIADASPAPRYVFFLFFNALLICFFRYLSTYMDPPSLQTRDGGSLSPHTTPYDPPSLQTRDGGSLPPHTIHTTPHDPPSLQTRDGGSLSPHTTPYDPPSLQTRDGGSLPPHTNTTRPHPRYKRETVGFFDIHGPPRYKRESWGSFLIF